MEWLLGLLLQLVGVVVVFLSLIDYFGVTL